MMKSYEKWVYEELIEEYDKMLKIYTKWSPYIIEYKETPLNLNEPDRNPEFAVWMDKNIVKTKPGFLFSGFKLSDCNDQLSCIVAMMEGKSQLWSESIEDSYTKDLDYASHDKLTLTCENNFEGQF